jgi:ATP-dependent helicase/nuclease subunit A
VSHYFVGEVRASLRRLLQVMSFTPQQQQAIAARGNVLVIAGAGTGKTRTLVERCLNILLEEKPPVSLEEILMVSFTEAAAAEMRQRIRARLEEELAKTPNTVRWHEQLALFDTAHIGTLHSFCLQLVRQHFYELELDPQLAVLPEEEARLLADETLDTILQSHYAGDNALAEAVQGLIQTQGRGWDKPIRALVLKLHNYTQTLPDPESWFREQLEIFQSPEPVKWRRWLEETLIEWTESSLAFLQPLASQNELAAKAAALLRGCDEGVATTLARLREIPATCPRGKKGALLDPLDDFFDEVEFLFSVTHKSETDDPLAEDWNWTRTNMLALLRLARDFSLKFAGAKRELGALDFHDLEQHALRLLWDRAAKQPTAIARVRQRKLRFIFVDEYQDINAVQDKIIEALSRDSFGVPPSGGSAGARTAMSARICCSSVEPRTERERADSAVRAPAEPPEGGTPNAGNRFLVGDIKQSIYRFRLANPRIFQNYAETWRGETGRAIPLTENFRSREGLLTFVNSLFELLMRREVGGIAYDEQAKLRFGAPEDRRALGVAENPEPRVELHLRLTGGASEPDDHESETDTNLAELEEANKEARLVALRLRELKEQRHQIWNERAKSFRAVDWSDMAVLLRSPSGKAEIYAKEFSQVGVPLVVARGGFFASMEISDLLSLLRLLDNPLQDLPALSVLHSPLVGLTVDELATIRLAATKVPFWTALNRSQQSDVRSQKVETFLTRFARWRRLVRQASLSRCLEAVLAETHYAEGLLTQPRGEQRRANVQRLLNLAQQFDQFQRQGLFRFLRFVEAQQAADLEPEVAAATEENAVRLMSIHQSKGLEFPVVAVANLGKPFNFSDLSADIILDEQFGLCPQIQPPQTGRRYPSLPHWLARRRQKIETLGEELRLLYVATTRARDTLILTASISEKKFESRWNSPGGAAACGLLSARSYADWLGIWFAKNCASPGNLESAGQTSLLRWTICDDAKLVSPDSATADAALDESDFAADAEVWNELEQRLAWQYPFKTATERTAKVSVSTLRREAAESADEEAGDWVETKFQIPNSKFRIGRNKKSAADIGTAHHKFLQFVSLERLGGGEELKGEAERLERGKVLSTEEIALLDFNALASFWQSELGRNIRKRPGCVRRELAFTARFSAMELAEVTGKPLRSGLADEFVVVQGVADLAVILEKEIWLMDFKTDDVSRNELADKVKTYAPQLKLYAMALSRIYQTPVSACWLHFLSVGRTESVAV